MKTIYYFKIFCFALILCCFIVGCETKDSPEVKARNKETLSKEGEYIGSLPDGRSICRYEIDNGASPNHWVYVVYASDAVRETITVNRHENKANRVEVLIDGVKYEPVE